MNFVPGRVRRRRAASCRSSPFDLPDGAARRGRRPRPACIAGIRPEHFEDAGAGRRRQGRRRASPSTPQIDVIEWLGNEQYAYIPYEARPTIGAELARAGARARQRAAAHPDRGGARPGEPDRRRRQGRDLVRPARACTCSTRATGDNLTPADGHRRDRPAERREPGRDDRARARAAPAGRPRPELLALPWRRAAGRLGCHRRSPLRDIPVGPSRHLVRFVEADGRLWALKELPPRLACKEYDVLRELEERALAGGPGGGRGRPAERRHRHPGDPRTSSGRGSTGGCSCGCRPTMPTAPGPAVRRHGRPARRPAPQRRLLGRLLAGQHPVHPRRPGASRRGWSTPRRPRSTRR